tara:strand:+ start:235 stop:657 length:423 start_codon:yes stop_codon:yes gene_type:complete
MNRLTILSIPMLFLLQGCYQASLTPMLGPVAGASQGKITYSAVSTSVSYGVKHKTGKFPIEHVIKREKDRIVKKLDVVEKELIEKSTSIKKNLVYKKDNLKIKDKAAKKLRWVLHLKEIKNVKQEDAFPANEPRYSYWPK